MASFQFESPAHWSSVNRQHFYRRPPTAVSLRTDSILLRARLQPGSEWQLATPGRQFRCDEVGANSDVGNTTMWITEIVSSEGSDMRIAVRIDSAVDRNRIDFSRNRPFDSASLNLR